jgi:DNA polymerase-3 subunit alpha
MIDEGLKLGEYEFKDYSDNIFKNLKIDCSDFVNKINVEFTKDKNHIPKFNCNGDSFEYLKELSFKGLNKRLNNKITKEYEDRLNYELNIINKMGYVDYFLIVFDYVRYALKNKIFVGCGRGSAVGSLVSYSLGISWIDPIKYNLIFERFLNPERITMPDIDVDFEDERRDEVINYVKETYGEERVSNIIAYGTFTAKDVIRTVAKLNNVDEGAIDSITKVLDSKLSLKDNLNIPEVASIVRRNSSLRKVYEEAKYLEGIKSRITVHAAGIVISDDDLTNNIPVVKNGDVYLSGYQKDELESLGILKMDFLSVTDLTIIRKVSELVKKYEGINIDLNYLNLNDKKTYDLIANGDTSGIFQLKTPMMKNYLKKAKVKEFRDLVMALAINRPGPLTQIPLYLDRKNNGKRIEYIIDDLKPILEETDGIMIYQEQVMEVFRKLANYSFSEADLIRRAISKKKMDIISNEKTRFIDNAIKNGYEKESVEKVYDMIVDFADYGFNKSHSVAYALVAYQMAYFKANYFPQFIINILNESLGDINKNASYLKYAMVHNVNVFKPNVNVSTNKYIYNSNGIFIPFVNIKSCGEAIASQIVEERKNGLFKSFSDFKFRCPFLNQKLIEALVYAGALDIFGDTKKSMLDNISNQDELFLEYLDGVVKTKEEFDYSYLKEKELEYLGMNIEYSIYNNIEQKLIKYKAIKLKDAKLGSEVRLLIEFVDVKTIKTKKNDRMLVGELQDETKKVRFVIFPNVLNEISDKIMRNNLYLIKGKYENDNKGFNSVIIDKLALIKL